jgi:glucose-6-phosphate 1-dehydrogenase
VRFRKPPTLLSNGALKENHLRFRISPDVAIGMGMMTLASQGNFAMEPAEMLASSAPQAGDMEAYERLLTAAMEGDGTLFAREDYVEEAWRIVDPIVKDDLPPYEYDPNTWGPREVDRITPEGGWHNPVVAMQ